ncbi:MAG: DarT1-associated NADAR antitoxin family protein [Trichloromonadaceae bacterium]
MAQRPIYIPLLTGKELVRTCLVEFQWFPGLSKVQKQKSINSLHDSAIRELKLKNVLEISSKSGSELGINLSAFNLSFTTKKYNRTFTVETAFQSSKVFESGGPYYDLLDKTSREAKKDERLKNSGRLLEFKFFGKSFPLEPMTLFYDWLYINALITNEDLSNEITKYDGFTDIEFNPSKSINCQAHSAALYVSLVKRGLLENGLSSVENFKEIIISKSTTPEQISLF